MLKAVLKTHLLQFRFEAGTSRGVLTQKYTYYIGISENKPFQHGGIGEASPLEKLSPDDLPDFQSIARHYCRLFSENPFQPERIQFNDLYQSVFDYIRELIPPSYPSLRFAFETALLDYVHGGKKVIFPGDFTAGKKPIQINGLIWMGDPGWMSEQISEKLEKGFRCLKLKIGAIDFEEECALLEKIRKRFGPDEVSLRVDANGAFKPDEALSKLQRLSQYDLHSIEQPIARGQTEAMKFLCMHSPLAIALDEELIGVYERAEKEKLLKELAPNYIILKPTLTGGMFSTLEWIRLAEQYNTGWWITSALESNVGLNAIAQLTASLSPTLPQGLGTGSLYQNNIDSALKLDSDKLFYDPETPWANINEIT